MVSGEETLTELVVVKNEDLAMEKVRQALNKFEAKGNPWERWAER